MLLMISMWSAHRKNDVFRLFWGQFLLWKIFFCPWHSRCFKQFNKWNRNKIDQQFFDDFSEIRVQYQYYVVDDFYEVRASQKWCFSSFLGTIFTLEKKFFAHVTFVVFSNAIKQTASKSANNFLSYKRTHTHIYSHTYTHYCFIKGED